MPASFELVYDCFGSVDLGQKPRWRIPNGAAGVAPPFPGRRPAHRILLPVCRLGSWQRQSAINAQVGWVN